MPRVGSLRPGEADVLVGGPPCQPFSKSGYWAHGDAKRLADPRADTLEAYIRVLEEAEPKAFLLENVGGLAFSEKDEGLRLILDRIENINRRTKSRYRPSFKQLKAAEYGVPQLRERFLIIGARDGTPFRFPSSTHGERGIESTPLDKIPRVPFMTAWDAIGDQPADGGGEDLAIRGKWADLLPSIPEGQNYLWHTERGGGLPLFGWCRRYWNFLLKLAKNQPSWTVQAQPGPSVAPFHWNNRRLSVRELCRIQTFPDDVRITGDRTAAQRQIGNAVPSLLAEVLARAIGEQFLGMPHRRMPPNLLPKRVPTSPPAERLRAVPAKFRILTGTHEAHPGTGMGYGAVARRIATV